ETRSEHPLARAILRYGSHNGVIPARADETAAIPGKGVRARIEDRTVYGGTRRLFQELGETATGADREVEALEAAGRTVVLVGRSDPAGGTVEVLGLIALADRVREGAVDALRELHAAGI